MKASLGDLDCLFVSIVPKLWSFAFRLAQDECLAQKLVLRAFNEWLNKATSVSPSNEQLIEMLSGIQAAWLAEDRSGDRHAKRKPRLQIKSNRHRKLIREQVKTTKRSLDPIVAVQNLPSLPRIAMLLVYAEGLSYPEAASVIGVSTRRIQQLICHARLTIADAV
jgi:RNA polymerase sigma-70 factor (ECF subfamily)